MSEDIMAVLVRIAVALERQVELLARVDERAERAEELMKENQRRSEEMDGQMRRMGLLPSKPSELLPFKVVSDGDDPAG